MTFAAKYTISHLQSKCVKNVFAAGLGLKRILVYL